MFDSSLKSITAATMRLGRVSALALALSSGGEAGSLSSASVSASASASVSTLRRAQLQGAVHVNAASITPTGLTERKRTTAAQQLSTR